ncbi:DUF4351 domain-containing protein [Methanospirillum stamsii]|uniref:DUF4351 domain-containing protein n=1 Tax=Methanospirillum stamsii TaxID=1277351 RepID=A0A2V2NIZ6_9EURY|nr:DUF4351 domain-containing protein [Methanospirillum stamsii]PWR75581.1 hypothetical protein DLD82_03075 [Methanospirillum stamsii]
METRDEFVDLIFRLENGDILHIEEQTSLTEEDLIRFAHYDLRIFSKYHVRIHTVILSPACSKKDSFFIDTGCLHYTVTHQIIRGRNADEALERIKKEVANGNPVNELELIFVPLMESRLPVQDLLFETIKLEKQIKDENLKNKVIALTMVMSNRLVEAYLIEKIWEEIKMLKILKYAEDKGKEQGIVIGIEQGIEQGLEKGRTEEKLALIERLLVKKFGPLPKDTLTSLQNMDSTILDILSFEILDFQSIDDLFNFIKKMTP